MLNKIVSGLTEQNVNFESSDSGLISFSLDFLDSDIADAVKSAGRELSDSEKNTVKNYRSLYWIALLHEDPNKLDQSGATVLIHATYLGFRRTVKYLLSIGSDPNCCNVNNDSVLTIARDSGHNDICRLLETQIDLNEHLCRECLDNNLDNVKELVKLGAQINGLDEDKDTPLTIASRWGSSELIKFLLENGADVNSKYHTQGIPIFECLLRI